MRRQVLVGIGALLVLAGGVWALQGLGYVRGSAMTGVTFWAIAGPIVALAGVALIAAGLRSGRP
jgi:hypothetical protein